MTLETDLLFDRRRLKRRLVFWRVLAVLAVVVALIVVFRGAGLAPSGAHVARVTVKGMITEDPKLVEAINGLARDPKVKAVILSIDSPGGAVAGGESLHDAIAKVAEAKPVVTVMGGLAASAGYMIAVPTTRIFARESTLTGSIGVLLETAEFSGLLDKVGITPEVIKSGPLKDEPGLTHPLSPAGQKVMQGLVDDLYEQFVAMVATGRHMDPAKVRSLGDGRPYTGHQALGLGLIDAIGGETEARAWLAKAKGVSASLPVADVAIPGRSGGGLLGSLTPILDGLLKRLISQSVSLDGPMAVWQRSGN